MEAYLERDPDQVISWKVPCLRHSYLSGGLWTLSVFSSWFLEAGKQS